MLGGAEGLPYVLDVKADLGPQQRRRSEAGEPSMHLKQFVVVRSNPKQSDAAGSMQTRAVHAPDGRSRLCWRR